MLTSACLVCLKDTSESPFWTLGCFFSWLNSWQGEVHFFVWPMLAGFLGTWMGLLLSPYVNSLSKPKMCFLDVVSIHQTDQETVRRDREMTCFPTFPCFPMCRVVSLEVLCLATSFFPYFATFCNISRYSSSRALRCWCHKCQIRCEILCGTSCV